ncbi:MAG: class I SAM-dependent methyltransferase [Flavobacteriales bacterium]|nr:class I SAM-dependent methyltransferase [Flavobacteriales bacterium]
MKGIAQKYYRFFSGKYQRVFLDYPVQTRPRLAPGNVAYERMRELIAKNDNVYKAFLSSAILPFKERLWEILPADSKNNSDILPTWNNGFFPGLDMMALYGMLSKYKPCTYIEVGSGNSTRMARKAIKDQSLATRLLSVDPFPRRSIEGIADVIIRQPLEKVDVQEQIVRQLKANDILFIDNSHRSFANSDATVFFLEILPFLKKGVIVHVHDVYLPYDYPQTMCDRFYNEQYLLASMLLSSQNLFDVIFPCYYTFMNPEINQVISSVWQHPNLETVEQHGGSFWLQIR